METETQPVPPPVGGPTPVSPTPKKSSTLTLLLVVLVLAGLAAGAYVLKLKTVPEAAITPTPTPAPAPTPTPDPTPGEYSILPNPPAKGPLVEGKVNGEITWHYPEKGTLKMLKREADYASSEFLELGRFNSGKYQGQYVYVAFVPCDCLGGGMVRLIADSKDPATQKKFVILTKYSDPIENFGADILDMSKISLDAASIADLDHAKTIVGSNSSQTLVLSDERVFSGRYRLFNSEGLKLVFNDARHGSVYTDANSGDGTAMYGFYVKAPDWSMVDYKVIPDFIGKDGVPEVTWTIGTQNTEQYVYTDRTGCGSNYAAVTEASVVNRQKDLILAGTTSKNQSVYVLTDGNHPLLKDLYEKKYYVPEGEKMSYEQFLLTVPMFFWVDPFDRLIKFTKFEFQAQAECGKPVIYLYPEQTTDVSVKVNPVGGFKFTEPDYNGGWNVVAEPNGKLTNKVDGKTYPYLFWEGWGGIYETPKRGWSVARADVPEFITEKLKLAGLNDQEIADFNEFWLPYFQDKPYYFITFMGNLVMDQIAPLEITPKPDTVIRVLMDFYGSDTPLDVEGYEIRTPQRRGFTVVEWGGVK